MNFTIKLHLASIAKLALRLWELSTVHTKHLYFSLVLVSYHPFLINHTCIYLYHFSSHLQTMKYLWLWENFVYLFSAISNVTFALFVIFEYSTMYLHVVYVLGWHWLWRAVKFKLVYCWLGGEKGSESILKECIWDGCINHTIHYLHELLIGMTFIC